MDKKYAAIIAGGCGVAMFLTVMFFGGKIKDYWSFMKWLGIIVAVLVILAGLGLFSTRAGRANIKTKTKRVRDLILDKFNKWVTESEWVGAIFGNVKRLRGEIEGLLPEIIYEEMPLIFALTDYSKREEIFGAKYGAVRHMGAAANNLETAPTLEANGTFEELIGRRKGWTAAHMDLIKLLNFLNRIDPNTLKDRVDGTEYTSDQIKNKIQAVCKKINESHSAYLLYQQSLRMHSANKVLEALRIELIDQYAYSGEVYNHTYKFINNEQVDDEGRKVSELIAAADKTGRISKKIKNAIDKSEEEITQLPLSKLCIYYDAEWKFYLEDMKFGMYHPFSRTVFDYRNGWENRVFKDNEVERSSSPTTENPAFDRKALVDHGFHKYWGKDAWGAGAKVDVTNKPNPYPTVSTLGMSQYMVHKVRRFSTTKVREYLQFFVGERQQGEIGKPSYTRLSEVAEAKEK